MPQFGKTRPLKRENFAQFERAFGDDPLGKAPRTDEGDQGRFRRFTREQVAVRGDDLRISWLRDEGSEEVLPEPDMIAAEIIDTLRTALEEIESLADLLDPNKNAPDDVAEAAE